MVLWAVLAAVMGAAVASFAQLAVDRAEPGRSAGLLHEASRCARCGAAIRAGHVLPVVGFMLLRGRCRVCRAEIPRRHLTGELTLGALWALVVVSLGMSWWLPLALLAPVLVILLRSGAVRGVGWRWWSAVVLISLGVAVLVLGLGAAASGRGWLYVGCGATGVGALLVAARLTAEESAMRVSQPTSESHLPGM